MLKIICLQHVRIRVGLHRVQGLQATCHLSVTGIVTVKCCNAKRLVGTDASINQKCIGIYHPNITPAVYIILTNMKMNNCAVKHSVFTRWCGDRFEVTG